MKNRFFGRLSMTVGLCLIMAVGVYGQGLNPLSHFPNAASVDTGNMNFVVVDNSSGHPVDKQLRVGLFATYLGAGAVTLDQALFNGNTTARTAHFTDGTSHIYIGPTSVTTPRLFLQDTGSASKAYLTTALFGSDNSFLLGDYGGTPQQIATLGDVYYALCNSFAFGSNYGFITTINSVCNQSPPNTYSYNYLLELEPDTTYLATVWAMNNVAGTGVKSVVAGYGMTASGTNTVTVSADSISMATRKRVQKAIDSLNAVIGTKQPQLNGTGFVKASGTTISYDNSTYLTTISGISAGGDLTGTYPNPTIKSSVALAGSPTTTTQSAGDNSTKIATTAYVDGSVANSTYNSQSGTTYTLQASDKGKVVSFSNSSAITLTVPAGLGATFYCTIQQAGTGLITPTASSTTLNIAHGFTMSNGQYTEFSIIFTPTANVYILQGDMQ